MRLDPLLGFWFHLCRFFRLFGGCLRDRFRSAGNQKVDSCRDGAKGMSVEVRQRSDEDLAAEAAREGSDGPAFVALVERFRDRVWRICFRLLSNEQDANDAAQEVFLRLFLHRKTFEGPFEVFHLGPWHCGAGVFDHSPRTLSPTETRNSRARRLLGAKPTRPRRRCTRD